MRPFEDFHDPRMAKKSRHGCLTIFLGMIALGYAFGAFASLSYMDGNSPEAKQYPQWFWALSGVMCVLGLVCAIALWNWKKWGFYGLTALLLIGTLISLATTGDIIRIASSLLGWGLLYGLLQLQTTRNGLRAWSQLE